jgi:hypothetical protein
MGPLGFYARSQSESFGRDLGISDESEAKISANMARHGFEFASGAHDRRLGRLQRAGRQLQQLGPGREPVIADHDHRGRVRAVSRGRANLRH